MLYTSVTFINKQELNVYCSYISHLMTTNNKLSYSQKQPTPLIYQSKLTLSQKSEQKHQQAVAPSQQFKFVHYNLWPLKLVQQFMSARRWKLHHRLKVQIFLKLQIYTVLNATQGLLVGKFLRQLFAHHT